ncbi:protein-ribulosamine 3-kinase, chloroplastic [Selaginella moellendorffii]|nr:protein-ribulosamine 3-kinase, chloroplastic [Selaginella moellendorffii]|eukprot:XP_002988877.2 protein-ribulosamine 3-kinase, chloroplastic [Selaginella moellendorffii]
MAFSCGVRFFSPSPSPSPFAAPRSTSQRHLASASMASGGDGDGDPIRHWILGDGGATKITRITPVGGGCINAANRYDTDAGSFFVKTNRGIDSSMFEAEAAGLDAMYRTNTVRVPKPLKAGSLPRGGSFIIMEYIEFGGSTLHGQRELGRMLGKMHKAGISDRGFGFEMDNTIGSTPQPNPWTPDWITFFRDHRIGHQLELLLTNYSDQQIYEKGKKLLEKIPYLLRDLKDVQPCLLHGDLWSGNMAYDKDGKPVILDPACYYGHNEAEFGMSWCASFNSSFYDAYFKEMPKQKGFEDRLHLYKLYHYLNHYNLFGSSYRTQCISIISRYNNQL